MKKIVKFICPALLLLVVIGIIWGTITFSNFMDSGVHSFAGYTKMDFSESVYFIEANTKVVQGSGTLTICGTIQPEKSNGFSRGFQGLISISEYPIASEDGYMWFAASRSKGSIDIGNQLAPTYPHYWYMGPSDDTDLYCVFITLEDGSKVSAYPGNTEEEALENYDRFWDWFENH